MTSTIAFSSLCFHELFPIDACSVRNFVPLPCVPRTAGAGRPSGGDDDSHARRTCYSNGARGRCPRQRRQLAAQEECPRSAAHRAPAAAVGRASGGPTAAAAAAEDRQDGAPRHGRGRRAEDDDSTRHTPAAPMNIPAAGCGRLSGGSGGLGGARSRPVSQPGSARRQVCRPEDWGRRTGRARSPLVRDAARRHSHSELTGRTVKWESGCEIACLTGNVAAY